MGRRRHVAAVCLGALGAALVACEPAPPPPWASEVLSVNASGVGSGGADTAVVSPDGTKVAFRSHKSGFGPIDTNGFEDIYVRDLTTAETTLVSVNAAGTDSGNGRVTSSAVFDPAGTKVAFTSEATDLVPGDTNQQQDVFMHDLTTGTTSLVSVNASGTGPASGGSGGPAFSPDGTKIIFGSWADDLVPGDGNGATHAYMRDLVSGTTTRLSYDNDGNLAYTGAGVAAFTPDARRPRRVGVGHLEPGRCPGGRPGRDRRGRGLTAGPPGLG
jgi:Tol biopolymer transport system component